MCIGCNTHKRVKIDRKWSYRFDMWGKIASRSAHVASWVAKWKCLTKMVCTCAKYAVRFRRSIRVCLDYLRIDRSCKRPLLAQSSMKLKKTAQRAYPSKIDVINFWWTANRTLMFCLLCPGKDGGMWTELMQPDHDHYSFHGSDGPMQITQDVVGIPHFENA